MMHSGMNVMIITTNIIVVVLGGGIIATLSFTKSTTVTSTGSVKNFTFGFRAFKLKSVFPEDEMTLLTMFSMKSR